MSMDTTTGDTVRDIGVTETEDGFSIAWNSASPTPSYEPGVVTTTTASLPPSVVPGTFHISTHDPMPLPVAIRKVDNGYIVTSNEEDKVFNDFYDMMNWMRENFDEPDPSVSI